MIHNSCDFFPDCLSAASPVKLRYRTAREAPGQRELAEGGADHEGIDMTIVAPELACGPTRLPCQPGMTWLERVVATGWDVDQLTGCWEWRGVRIANGRARIAKSGARKYPYRVTYEAVYGPIPEGLFACHKCDNPGCVNPHHIVPGTNRENMQMIPRERIQKYSAEDAALVRRIYESGKTTQAQIGASMELSQKTVSRMIRGDLGPNRMSASQGSL